MADASELVSASTAAISGYFGADFPKTALILGSGLGAFADRIENARALSYAKIPGFAAPTVAGHSGQLIVGTVAGTPLVCMQGRMHIYEGHTAQALTVPIRALKRAGVEQIIITNAAGGIRNDMRPGTLMIIDDHINFSGQNPLIGPNDESFGPRFFDMSHAYDPQLRAQMRRAAEKASVAVTSGVYVFALGPNFETPSEIRMFATLGGDAIGMSTVPECLVANHCGMKVVGLSIITNLAAGIGDDRLTHSETLTEAGRAYDRVANLLCQFLADLKN